MSRSRAFGWAALKTTVALAPGLGIDWALRSFFTPTRRPPSAEVLEPFVSDTLPFEGLKLRVYRRTAHKAQRILLVHGWGGDAAQMARIARALEGSVTLLELPAHGASEGKQTNGPMMARAILAAAEQFGPFDAVVGHSLGCAAIGIAVRLGLQAKRLVFVSPAVDPFSYAQTYFRALGLSAAGFEAAMNRLTAFINWRGSDLSLTTIPEAVRPPTLIVHDLADRESPYADAEALAESWRGAQLVTTSALGHRRILDDQAVIARVADYLRRE